MEGQLSRLVSCETHPLQHLLVLHAGMLDTFTVLARWFAHCFAHLLENAQFGPGQSKRPKVTVQPSKAVVNVFAASGLASCADMRPTSQGLPFGASITITIR